MRSFQRDARVLHSYQVLKRNNASVVMYDALARAVAKSDNSITCLYTASGLRLPITTPGVLSSFSSAGIIYLAMTYGAELSGNDKIPNSAIVTALKAGQVMAPWCHKDLVTAADRERALHRVISCITNHPPSAADFRVMYTAIINKAREDSNNRQVYTRQQMAELLEVVGDDTFQLELPQALIQQKFHFVMMRGNAIPSNLLQSVQTQELWAQLADRVHGENFVEIPNDVTLDIVDEDVRIAAWKNWPTESKLAAIDAIATARLVDVLRQGVCYSLVATISMAKSGNVTDQFLTRRLASLAPSIPGVEITDLLQTDLISAFASHFPTNQLSPDELFSIVSAQYTIFKQLDIGPLCWILEQSAAANITTAMQVAEMVVKYPKAPFETVVDFVGREQVRAWASLVCQVSYDRFCSLAVPPVTMAAYPDLAYVAAYVMFVLKQGRQTLAGAGYKGAPDSRAKHPKDSLIRVAQIIADSEQSAVEAAMSLAPLLEELHPNYSVVMTDEKYYLIPKQQVPDNEGVAPGQDQAPVDAQQIRARHITDPAILNAIRAGWSREMKRAPAGTIELTASAAMIKIRQMRPENHVDKNLMTHLRVLAGALIDSGRQTMIETITENRVNPLQRKTKLSDAVQRAAEYFGVTIEDEWRVDPPAINPEAPAANIHTNRFFRTWRSDVAQNQGNRVGAANDNDRGAAQIGAVADRLRQVELNQVGPQAAPAAPADDDSDNDDLPMRFQ